MAGGILVFVVILFGLILITPFILKGYNAILDPFAEKAGEVSEEAGDAVEAIYADAVNFWDFVVMIAFLLNIILLLLSAFLVDTHPFFLIMFIIFGAFIFIIAPEVTVSLDQIYEDPEFALEVSQAPMVDFLRTNFWTVILGIWFIVGLILYGKFRYGSMGGTVY